MSTNENPFASRAEDLKRLSPHLFADLAMYPSENGGRKTAIVPGFGCPCAIERTRPTDMFDCWPLLGDEALKPGDSRRVGFFFLVPESAEIVRRAGKFFLWERRFFAEAVVLAE